jgi:alpha-L-arabinofuranosidase
VRTVFNAPEVKYDRDAKQATFWGLQGSASLHDNELVVTAVNPNVTQARETEITGRGTKAASATMTVLTAAELHAHNTLGNCQLKGRCSVADSYSQSHSGVDLSEAFRQR